MHTLWHMQPFIPEPKIQADTAAESLVDAAEVRWDPALRRLYMRLLFREYGGQAN